MKEIVLKIIASCIIGQVCFKALKLLLTMNFANKLNKKHLTLFLKAQKHFSRAEIIEIGKKAILDPLTQGIIFITKS
jgi:hypothetical protein